MYAAGAMSPARDTVRINSMPNDSLIHETIGTSRPTRGHSERNYGRRGTVGVIVIAELFFTTKGSLIDDADLILSTSRARCARRPDFRRRPSHGLPSDRVVPARAFGARLECESGGAAHARVGQALPTCR